VLIEIKPLASHGKEIVKTTLNHINQKRLIYGMQYISYAFIVASLQLE